ncbi:MAG: glutaredoxin [Candidatus Terraquivivens tikiterensis]|uniref:Glutaredoxin n=1 Tax=Candidatus Terraquivivens tikiterensis TaxID=1980982 RepID=A0A2R7Y3Q4_9ARCH|nr:MAG: glutaredoxin [Candidatus Terraquivivens tikiterensis]
MPILKEKEKKIVAEKLGRNMENEVKLVVFTQDFECEYCATNRELMEDLASLSDKIRLEVFDFEKDYEKAQRWGIDKIPATAVFGTREYGIRFFGLPTGYEFPAFLDTIVDASRGTTNLQPATKEKIKGVKEPVHIQVFVTPTCPYCPRAVRVAHQLAVENEFIKADMIDAIEFPQLANKYDVMAVPKIVINDVLSFEGALPEPHFVEYILLAIKPDRTISYR